MHCPYRFLLYLLEAYLFANGRQMVSLRWLALFRDFERARAANQGSVCLAYFYSSLDPFSRGTLRQLVGPWKLLEVSLSLSLSLSVSLSCSSCILIHMPYRLGLYIIFLLTASIPISCKLPFYHMCLANYTISVAYKLYHNFMQTVIS